MEDRKKDHIELAFSSRTEAILADQRFYYEPLLAAHPSDHSKPFEFLGRMVRVPIWISSMTGGTQLARGINTNLARVCHDFGMGMGLGSCRIILRDNQYFDDFNMRPVIGPDLPLWANLGIAQLEQLAAERELHLVSELVKRLEADGIIIHVNPMQEWLQPEGDRLSVPPVETIQRVLDKTNLQIIVKEVGQGMGPESLRQLLHLPLAGIEFGAFGGTNFASLELQRASDSARELFSPFALIGHTAADMLSFVNQIVQSDSGVRTKHLIISGGIRNFLDGYYLVKNSLLPAVYGQASAMLQFARVGYEPLHDFITSQVKGLALAEAYLRPRPLPSRNK